MATPAMTITSAAIRISTRSSEERSATDHAEVLDVHLAVLVADDDDGGGASVGLLGLHDLEAGLLRVGEPGLRLDARLADVGAAGREVVASGLDARVERLGERHGRDRSGLRLRLGSGLLCDQRGERV